MVLIDTERFVGVEHNNEHPYDSHLSEPSDLVNGFHCSVFSCSISEMALLYNTPRKLCKRAVLFLSRVIYYDRIQFLRHRPAARVCIHSKFNSKLSSQGDHSSAASTSAVY